jgi:hypothetical protein
MNQLEEDDKSTSDGVEDLLSNNITVDTSASDANKANKDSVQTEKKA